MTDLNQEVQLLALDVLDYLMDQGKIPVWTQIAAKNFLVQLINIVKTRDAPEVQAMILYLIKKWGLKFESYKEILPNFSEFYKALKNSNVTFPDEIQGGYHKYIGEELPEQNNYVDDFKDSNQELSAETNSYDLNANNYDKKYHKLIGKLSVWVENIILANEIIDNTEVGSQVDDGLTPVVDNLRSAENELVIYIQEKVKNEKLLGIMLSINDDINKTITRYDTIRARKKPEKFVSNGIRQRMEVLPVSSKDNKNNQNNQNNQKPKSNFTNSSNNSNNTTDDIFGISVPQANNNKNKQTSSTNDLFDIFNTSPVAMNNQGAYSNTNSNTNTNTNTTNTNTNNNIDIFNFVPQNQNNNFNNTNNSNNNTPSINSIGIQDPFSSNINDRPNKMTYTEITQMQNNSQNKVESLADKLKNAYIGREETGEKMNNMNSMNTMNTMNMVVPVK